MLNSLTQLILSNKKSRTVQLINPKTNNTLSLTRDSSKLTIAIKAQNKEGWHWIMYDPAQKPSKIQLQIGAYFFQCTQKQTTKPIAFIEELLLVAQAMATIPEAVLFQIYSPPNLGLPVSSSAYAELKLVAHNVKPVARLEANRDSLEWLNKTFAELHFRHNDFSAQFNNGLETKGGHATNKIYFYASRNITSAGQVKQAAILIRNYNRLKRKKTRVVSEESYSQEIEKYKGYKLGYPLCCTNAYMQTRLSPTPEILFEKIKQSNFWGYAQLNIFDSRYRNISHIPCNFHCRKSSSLAQKFSIVLQQIILPFQIGFFLYFKDGSLIKLLLENSPKKNPQRNQPYNYTYIYHSKGEFARKDSNLALQYSASIQEENYITIKASSIVISSGTPPKKIVQIEDKQCTYINFLACYEFNRH